MSPTFSAVPSGNSHPQDRNSTTQEGTRGFPCIVWHAPSPKFTAMFWDIRDSLCVQCFHVKHQMIQAYIKKCTAEHISSYEQNSPLNHMDMFKMLKTSFFKARQQPTERNTDGRRALMTAAWDCLCSQFGLGAWPGSDLDALNGLPDVLQQRLVLWTLVLILVGVHVCQCAHIRVKVLLIHRFLWGEETVRKQVVTSCCTQGLQKWRAKQSSSESSVTSNRITSVFFDEYLDKRSPV